MGFHDGTVQYKSDNQPKKVWHRNRALEERALKDWMYRVGTLGGILAAWIMVGTGILTFVELSIGAVVLVFCLTMWDFWKLWKGGPYE